MLARPSSEDDCPTPVDLICREIRKVRAEMEAIECDVIPHVDGRIETLLEAENDAWRRLAATQSKNIYDLAMKADHCRMLAEHDLLDEAYMADGLVAPLCLSVSNDVVRLECTVINAGLVSRLEFER